MADYIIRFEQILLYLGFNYHTWNEIKTNNDIINFVTSSTSYINTDKKNLLNLYEKKAENPKKSNGALRPLFSDFVKTLQKSF